LVLGEGFNQEVAPGFISQTQLEELTLPESFDQEFECKQRVLPVTLKQIILKSYNRAFLPGFFDQCPHLAVLEFRSRYNQPLVPGQFPRIHKLDLGPDFVQPLTPGCLLHTRVLRVVGLAADALDDDQLDRILPYSVRSITVNGELTGPNARSRFDFSHRLYLNGTVSYVHEKRAGRAS
jgi:hypothetical protein